jgi:hypothetical protein
LDRRYGANRVSRWPEWAESRSAAAFHLQNRKAVIQWLVRLARAINHLENRSTLKVDHFR